MRVYKKSKNIVKMIDNKRTIYVAYKDFDLIDKNYFKQVLKSFIAEQPKNYIMLTGVGYGVKMLCCDNLDQFLNGCCGIFGLRLRKEDILKYVS